MNASSPRLRALFAIGVQAIRDARDDLITAADLDAITAVVNARVAAAKTEAARAYG